MKEHPSLIVHATDKPKIIRDTLTPKLIQETKDLRKIKQNIKEQQASIQQVLTRLTQIEAKLDKYTELLDVKEEILRTNLRVMQGFEAILLREKSR